MAGIFDDFVGKDHDFAEYLYGGTVSFKTDPGGVVLFDTGAVQSQYAGLESPVAFTQLQHMPHAGYFWYMLIGRNSSWACSMRTARTGLGSLRGLIRRAFLRDGKLVCMSAGLRCTMRIFSVT